MEKICWILLLIETNAHERRELKSLKTIAFSCSARFGGKYDMNLFKAGLCIFIANTCFNAPLNEYYLSPHTW